MHIWPSIARVQLSCFAGTFFSYSFVSYRLYMTLRRRAQIPRDSRVSTHRVSETSLQHRHRYHRSCCRARPYCSTLYSAAPQSRLHVKSSTTSPPTLIVLRGSGRSTPLVSRPWSRSGSEAGGSRKPRQPAQSAPGCRPPVTACEGKWFDRGTLQVAGQGS